MKNMKKRIAVYSTMATLGMSSLAGCSKKNEEIIPETEMTRNEEKTLNYGSVAHAELAEFEGTIQEGDTKLFEPGDHNFAIRIVRGDWSSKDVETISVPNCPSYYEKTDKFPVILNGYTCGYDFWYTNLETVEVEAVPATYLEEYYMNKENFEGNKYDFNHFGTLVKQKETTEGPILKKQYKEEK